LSEFIKYEEDRCYVSEFFKYVKKLNQSNLCVCVHVISNCPIRQAGMQPIKLSARNLFLDQKAFSELKKIDHGIEQNLI
jgi:hypothetical protein